MLSSEPFGTSLSVYPAANIIDFVSEECEKYLINPKKFLTTNVKFLTFVKEKASIGIPILAKILLEKSLT